MKRLTKYICGRAHGAEGRTENNLTGSYCRGQFEATAIVERLAAIEDILGDDYNLDRIRELIAADKEGRCVILPRSDELPILKKGMSVWYVDTDSGEIEEGEVCSTYYQGGKLDSFSVEFKESEDFDEFFGSAWGACFFPTKEQAVAAFKNEKTEA